MPFLIPLLAAVGSFFSGAYIGSVVDNANKAPAVIIEDATVNQEKESYKKLVFYGLAGLAVFYAFKKLR